MTRHKDDDLTIAALRDLDPAPAADLTTAEQERAEAIFARIVATPVEGPVPVEPTRRRPTRRRLLVGAGLAGAAGITLPAVLLGGGSAYASWTPQPEALLGAAADEAGVACRAFLGAQDGGERVTIAESRGDWTFVLLAGRESEAICLMPDEAIGAAAAGEEDTFGAHDSDPAAPPAPADDGIAEGNAMSSSTSEGWFTWATGSVGRDVVGVSVHTSSGLDVEASIAGGRFVAWWPDDGTSWSYTVHLADGTDHRAHLG